MREVFPLKPHDSVKGDQKDKVLDEFPKFKIVKQEIINTIDSHTEGLDLKRVEEFMRSYELPIRDYVIFDEDSLDEKKVFEIFEKFGYKYDKEAYLGNWLAMCDTNLDLILIKRRENFEKFNGGRVTESVLVHELAHGTSGFSSCIVTSTGDILAPRTGFAVGDSSETTKGAFLEEGFVDMLAGKYNKQYMEPELRDKMLPIFRHKYNDYQLTRTRSDLVDNIEVVLPFPTHYAIFTSEYGFSSLVSAQAAFGLELLCDKEPKLFETMLKARNDVEYLRKIPQLINKISPGLYSELRKLKYTESGFSQGLYTIIEKVYGGKIGDIEIRKF